MMKYSKNGTMRCITGCLLAMIIVFSLCSCKSEPYTGNSAVNWDQYKITPGIVNTSYVTDEMMAEADMWPNQDDSAVAAVMKRAKAGEPVTIAVIGGSITQGSISAGSRDGEVGEKQCYANIFRLWWELMFPDSQITFVNAGIGGTDSYLGVHRVEEDVLKYHPDLVLVEYAVNDGDTGFCQMTYDNLVRRILGAENSPAVMLYFFGQTNGTTAQGKQAVVGARYGLPMLSYMNAFKYAMKAEPGQEKVWSGDGTHPSAYGHAVAGEILWHYLNEVYANLKRYKDPVPVAADPVAKTRYQNATILDHTMITATDSGTFKEAVTLSQYPNGWRTTAGEGGITFEVECCNIGILYNKTTDGKSGQFDVYVDGVFQKTLDADFSNGWGSAIEGKEVYTSGEKAKHTVEIRKKSGSTGDVFNFLGLLIS